MCDLARADSLDGFTIVFHCSSFPLLILVDFCLNVSWTHHGVVLRVVKQNIGRVLIPKSSLIRWLSPSAVSSPACSRMHANFLFAKAQYEFIRVADVHCMNHVAEGAVVLVVDRASCVIVALRRCGD